MPVKEITLEDLMTDSDWGYVFGEGKTYRNCRNVPDELDGGMWEGPIVRSDVAEIIAAVHGENDGDEWLGVFRLKDDQFLVATGSCDHTGWDCQAGNSLAVAPNLESAVRYGLTEDQAVRLGLPAGRHGLEQKSPDGGPRQAGQADVPVS